VDEGQQAQDAGEDHGCFEGAHGDEAEGHAFVLPLDLWVGGGGVGGLAGEVDEVAFSTSRGPPRAASGNGGFMARAS